MRKILHMNITFVLPTINLSGGTRVIVIYAQELVRRGHSVQLIYPPLQPLPFRRKVKRFLKGDGWRAFASAKPSHLDGSAVTHHELESWRPVIDQDVPDADVVVATWWETAEWVSALSPNKGAKVYFVQHHEIFEGMPKDRVQRTYRLPMHKIVVAKWLKDLMKEEYEDPFAELVPNSVDHNQFFASPRTKQVTPTIGFMYATAPYKRVDLAIAVITELRRQIQNLRIISFGSEPPSEALRLPDGCEYLNSPRQDIIRHLYDQCDVWLTTSSSEGFNLPAMEAMACRTPVVSTRTGWPEESIRTGYNGVLVDVEDKQALEEGVRSVLWRSESDWKKMSENAFATVKDSSWSESAKLFESALAKASSACMAAE